MRKKNRNVYISLVFKKKLRKDKPEANKIVVYRQYVEMGWGKKRGKNGTSLSIVFIYSLTFEPC